MVKSTTKLVYKPDSQSTDEFIMIVNHEEYEKWKAGDHSVPLVEVLDSFKVFHSGGQGNQGLLGEASHQLLDNTFGTHNELDVATQMLEKGSTHASEGFQTTGITKNVTRGDIRMDNRAMSGAK